MLCFVNSHWRLNIWITRCKVVERHFWWIATRPGPILQSWVAEILTVLYIYPLIFLNRLACPSAWPLLEVEEIACRTAGKFCRIPNAKPVKGLSKLIFWHQFSGFPLFLLVCTRWSRLDSGTDARVHILVDVDPSLRRSRLSFTEIYIQKRLLEWKEKLLGNYRLIFTFVPPATYSQCSLLHRYPLLTISNIVKTVTFRKKYTGSANNHIPQRP